MEVICFPGGSDSSPSSLPSSVFWEEQIPGRILPGRKGEEGIALTEGPGQILCWADPSDSALLTRPQLLILHLPGASPEGLSPPEYKVRTTEARSEFEAPPPPFSTLPTRVSQRGLKEKGPRSQRLLQEISSPRAQVPRFFFQEKPTRSPQTLIWQTLFPEGPQPRVLSPSLFPYSPASTLQISPYRQPPEEQRALSARNRFSEFGFVASEED